MNKKLFLGALLVGAIALNSCVDDKESPSVTNVREAKAEQLKAVGEAAKTQAEAAKIAAEAEAKVKEAQAKLIAAQEAAQVAQTEIDKEKAAAEIDKLKQELAASIAKTNAEIEKIKAQAENQLLANQKDLLANQKTENEQLINLLTGYSNNTVLLVKAQRELVKAQNALAAYEADLVEWEDLRPGRIAAKLDAINQKTQEIAENDAQLQTLKQYDGNIAAAQEQLPVAKAEATQLLNQKSAAKADKEKTDIEYRSALEKVNNSLYLQMMKDSIASVFDRYAFTVYDSDGKRHGIMCVGSYIQDDQDNLVGYKYTLNEGIINYEATWNGGFQFGFEDGSVTTIPLSSGNYNFDRIVYSFEEGQKLSAESYNVYPSTFLVMTDKLYKDAEAALNKYVEKYQKANVTAAQSDYDKYVAAAAKVATAQADKDAADKVVKDIRDAGGEPTKAQTDDQTAKEAALTAAVSAYETVYGTYSKDEVKGKTDDYATALATAQAALERAQVAIAKFTARYKSLSAQQATYEGYITTLNAAEKTDAESNVAYEKVSNALSVKNKEVSSLDDIINGGIVGYKYDEETGTRKPITIVEAIKLCEQNQVTYADELDTLNAQLAELENQDYDSTLTESEKKQALTEAIEDAQMNVDAAQKKVDAYKAAIDQLSAETPAE